MNVKHKQNQVNKKLQNFMYGMLTDTHVIAAKKSAEVRQLRHNVIILDSFHMYYISSMSSPRAPCDVQYSTKSS